MLQKSRKSGKPTKIKNPTFSRVDLVDEGANQFANIMLVKEKEEDNMKFEERFATYTKDDQDAISKEMQIRVAKARMEAILEYGNEDLVKSKDAKITELEAEVEDLKKEKETLSKSKEGEKSEKNLYDIIKSVDPDAAEAYKASQEALEKAKEVKEEAELVEIAKSYDKLPIEEGELVKVLKSLKADETVFETVTELFKAISNGATSENLEKQKGQDGTDDVISDSEAAYNKLTALAKARQAEKKDMTFAKAMTEVSLENPDLYSVYENLTKGE